MRTETIEIFKFQELSEKGKKRALDLNRNYNVDTDHWYEYTLDLWKSLLGSIGIEDAEINFSGFCSQGDGACIRSASFDSTKLAKFMASPVEPSSSLETEDDAGRQAYLQHRAEYIPPACSRWDWINYFQVLDEFSFNLETINHRYQHENCHRLSIDGMTGRKHVDKAVDQCEQELEELRRDLCIAIYSDLEREYKYMTSDAAVAESMVDNEQEFYATGERY